MGRSSLKAFTHPQKKNKVWIWGYKYIAFQSQGNAQQDLTFKKNCTWININNQGSGKDYTLDEQDYHI